MDLFIVSLRENFWSPGKHEFEHVDPVYSFDLTLYDYFLFRKVNISMKKYNSILERIGFWLIYPIYISIHRIDEK